jgi:hypothetical protein
MELTVHIPDDIAERLGGSENENLSRRALEAFLAEEYRLGRIHKPDLRRLLGFETSYEIDGFPCVPRNMRAVPRFAVSPRGDCSASSVTN